MSSTSAYSLTAVEQERAMRVQSFGDSGAAGVRGLLAMLTEPSWAVRRLVVEKLAQFGDSAVNELCQILVNERSSEARLAATVDALVASTGEVESEILKLATHADPAVLADVVQVLGRRRNQQATPALIKLSHHSDDNVAVGAIEALGRMGGRAAVEALIDLVNSGNFFRTFPAIDVLGRSGDPRGVEPLAKLLKNANYLPEAARALGRSGDRNAVEPLIELLTASTDAVVRLAAVSLWDLRDRFQEKTGIDGVFIEELIRGLAGSDCARRLAHLLPSADATEGVALCRLLGVIASPEAVEALDAILDGDTAIAASAADALKKIGRGADNNLLTAIRDGDSERRKILLPIVTRTASGPAVVGCLTDPDVDVRSLACETLARIGFADSIDQVFPLLADTNLRVVHAAIAAVQSLGTREARQLALQTCKSANPIARRSALRILGYFGDSSSLQSMLDGLNDTDLRVREAALQGLPYIDSHRAVETLLDESKSENPRNRALALRSLGQIPKMSERICSLLLKALSDPDPWARYYACQSLGRVAYAPAAPEIAELLNDPAGQVRVSAVEALSQLDSEEAREALRSAVNFDDVDVRRAAIVGLGIANRLQDMPIVLAALTSADIPTRLIALSALVNFHSPQVLLALTSAADDSDEQVRSAAIGFLAARPEQEATEILIELLRKESSRERARSALLVPNYTRVSGILSALQTADDELAPLLISILIRIEKPEAKLALLTAIKIENVPTRKAVATAFASRREAEVHQALRDAAQYDPDPGVRKICELSLQD